MGMRSATVLSAVGIILLVTLSSCYVMRPSSGAGQTVTPANRELAPDAIRLPAGYRVELVTSGLTYPVSAAVDDNGRLYVVESGYSYGEDFTEPRLLRVESDGRAVPIATGGKGGPWTGVIFHRGNF